MKMFFERQTLNPNNEKYLLKTIISYIYHIIYGSTTTAIANLNSLANIGPKVKFYFQLPSLLLVGLTNRKLPMQCAMSEEVYVNKEQKIKPLFHCTYRQISFVKALPTTFVL